TTGHIGINLTLALLQTGHQVKAICRKPEKMKVLGPLDQSKIILVKGDILRPDDLIQAFQGVDVVIHLAAKISIDGDRDGEVQATNVIGTRNVVQACLENQVKKLIHFSSIHAFAYTRHTTLVDENSPYAGHDAFAYDQSKALGEKEVLKGIAEGLKAIILNPTAVIGPHDYFHSRSGVLLAQLFAGEMPILINGGFDWVDVRDVVNATLFVLQNEVPSNRYVLSGHRASFRQLSELCQSASGIRVSTWVAPLALAFTGLPFIRLAQIFTQIPPLYTYESLMIIKNAKPHFSSFLAQKELNYTPRPLEETIEETYAWLLSNRSSALGE
ncbi:MAG: NAD-dependent epimerase/dehydratase family protein, partial [Bacteroidota bacterium]